MELMVDVTVATDSGTGFSATDQQSGIDAVFHPDNHSQCDSW